ncbi:MAG TPA: MobF family relaxase, partial [Mycobacterium sp.]
MNAGIHKLTAGGGYLYLIRQVAANDATHRGRPSLSDYYSQKGESPGRWMGRGLAALGQPVGRELLTDKARDIWNVQAGSVVTEDQMRALFGLGLHPNAAAIAEHLISQGAPKAAGLAAGKLGRPFQIRDGATELQRRVAVALRDHNLIRGQHWSAPVEDEVAAPIRTKIARELFAAEYGREPSDDRELSGYIARESREPTTSVAGYDLRFTPVKSVSVLWALAPLDVARVIEECHEHAVTDALDHLQEHAAFTRTGNGGVAQIDTEGFIAAAFMHRDSRAGDPHLHTHVPISNKVRGVGADGIPRWLALDGRPLFKATVAASELYNTRLEAYLIEALGLVFAEREQREDRGKRPVREVVGIGVELIDLFSSSLRAIETRYAELAAQFHAREGREPTLKESIDLYERAHLDTRKAKHEPRSLAEQRSQWKDQAVQLLGGVAELTELLGSVLTGHRQASQELTQQWVDGQAALVVETVAATRSIWQRTHVFAEAQRRVRETDAHASMRVAERITDAALAQHSIAYARDLDADLGEPEALRRRDGSSVYTTHGTHLYTSAAVVSAERRILAAAQLGDGRCVGEQAVSLALLEAHANGRTLNPGQHALVRHMACSGARVSLALAPPGTGKTTAMATLAQAWQEEGGHVVGLASSANAARLLRDDMARQGVAIDADTVDKLVWLTHNPDAREDPARSWFDRIGNRTLIIVDEAGKSGTLKLDAVIRHALARGASVRLIGDDKQLSSIEAGGILTDIAHSAGAVTLTDVMRFASRAEAAAMLALRDGDPAGLAFYADNHRIHVASDQTAADMAFDRWQEDLAKGWDSQLLAPTNETVKALNRRAQVQYLGTDNRQAAHAELSDGLQASVGDIISTRKNARTLRIGGGRDFVRNGYRWTVTKVHRSGALTATQVGSRRKVTLPTWYVTEHTTLGYASTIDAIQGDTIGDRNRPGTCHVVGCDTLTRQHITTSMSRARTENHIYLSTAETDPHRILSPKATHPETAIDVLTRAVGRDAAQVSATTAQRQAQDPFRRLGPAAARYLDAVGAGAEHQVDPAVLQRIDTHADTIYPELTQSGAWPVLRRHLAIIALAGDDPVERLREAAGRSELDTAADCAAVLDWRLDYSGAHSAGIGPLRWLPDIPAALDQHPAWGEYLRGRRDLVAGLADEIRDTANEWTQRSAPTWARGLLSKPKLVAEIAVFRAATGVEDADSRVTGPEQYPVRARKIQRLLEGAAQQITGPADDYRRFNDLIDRIDPRIRRDQYWTPLAASLATIGRTGVDVGQLLSEVAAQGPLPDEMPAAALWWRLSGTLTPAAVQTNSTRLRPDWMRDLHAVCGSALTETIAADPAFPGLVAAVGAADPARWTPRELLEVAFEHLRDIDQTLRPDECARLLTYTIDLFASEHPFDRDIPLPDEPMSAQEEEELAETGVYVIPEQFDQHIGEELPSQSVIGVNPDHLTFEDLSTDRPTLPAISADVYGLRDAHERARADLAAASARTATGLHIPDISDDTDTLTGALACAAAGFYILPVRRGTKHPGSVIGKGWHTKSSRDPKVIAAWFAGTDHDIAIHCGRSGALAFDVDYPEKLTDLLAAHLLDPAVPYHSTRPDQPGRGHYLFAMPPGR